MELLSLSVRDVARVHMAQTSSKGLGSKAEGACVWLHASDRSGSTV
jgi:hypothetical protein